MKISLYLSLGGHFYLKLYHIRVKNKLQKKYFVQGWARNACIAKKVSKS